MGRNYENHKLQYFLLEDACPNGNQMKMKIKKWIGIPDSRQYEKFLLTWHDLRKELQERLNEDNMKAVNMQFLHIFCEDQYMDEDFYGQFACRLKKKGDLL